MGKTPMPLRVLVHHSLRNWPEWEKLAAQGHVISILGPNGEITRLVCPAGTKVTEPGYDVALGPVMWRMDDRLKKHLDAALAEARKAVYPPKEKT